MWLPTVNGAGFSVDASGIEVTWVLWLCRVFLLCFFPFIQCKSICKRLKILTRMGFLWQRYSYCWETFGLLPAVVLYQFTCINSTLLFKLWYLPLQFKNGGGKQNQTPLQKLGEHLLWSCIYTITLNMQILVHSQIIDLHNFSEWLRFSF